MTNAFASMVACWATASRLCSGAGPSSVSAGSLSKSLVRCYDDTHTSNEDVPESLPLVWAVRNWPGLRPLRRRRIANLDSPLRFLVFLSCRALPPLAWASTFWHRWLVRCLRCGRHLHHRRVGSRKRGSLLRWPRDARRRFHDGEAVGYAWMHCHMRHLTIGRHGGHAWKADETFKRMHVAFVNLIHLSLLPCALRFLFRLAHISVLAFLSLGRALLLHDV